MSSAPAIPDHRLAICRRCRWPERRAHGAATEEALRIHARTWAQAEDPPCHVRLSQCLNCCDGGHTVRVEWQEREVALVGIRTLEELQRVLDSLEAIAAGKTPEALRSRVYQIWEKGVLVWHRNHQEPAGD